MSELPQRNPEIAPSANPWLITVAVMLPTFVEVLETAAVNGSQVHISGSLSATTSEATSEGKALRRDDALAV